MTQITEIAPDIYRISTVVPEANLQFNQFLVRDEQPLLFHTGMKGLFPVVRDAVATEASLLFEETHGTLLCSDLFHQNGDVEPSTSADVVGRFKQLLVEYQQGPFAHYMPYTPYTEPTLQRLAALKPRTLATMHGSTFVGDGERALADLAQVMKEILAGG